MSNFKIIADFTKREYFGREEAEAHILQMQPPTVVLQICAWQLLPKSFKYVCEGVKL